MKLTRGASIVVAISLVLAPAGMAGARNRQPQTPQPPAIEGGRQVILLLANCFSFEQMMALPAVDALARSGGAALMSPRTVAGDTGLGSYLTLGAGVRSAVVAPPRTATGPLMSASMSGLPPVGGAGPVPGLMASVLEHAGLSTVLDAPAYSGDRASGNLPAPGALVAVDSHGQLPYVGTGPAPEMGDLTVVDLSRPPVATTGMPSCADAPTLSGAIRSYVSAATTPQVLVIVLTPYPSIRMNQVKDELTPIVMAEGSPSSLLPVAGSLHTLTSDTTRRVGVVSNEDVAPTILAFLGAPVPAEMNGSTIRVVDAPAPFALHARHLSDRRMWWPVQIGAAIALALLALTAFAIAARFRGSDRWRTVGCWAALVPLPLTTAMLAAGHLPSLSYATVVPFVGVCAAAVPAAALLLRKRGPLDPTAAIGLAVLAYFVFEALGGWFGAMFTFLGGTELDGARWYGLPNAFEGVLLGAALYVSARLKPYSGFVLLFAVGLFDGLPNLGADLGGALVMFVAAGLWLGLRGKGRLRWRELEMTALVVVLGMAIVLVANRFAALPTHGTRFVENASHEGLVRVLVDRLAIGWRLLVRNPFGFIPLLLLPLSLWVTLRPPRALAAGFARYPQWRDVVLVALLSSFVAYFANDTGVASMGMGVASAAAALLYVPLSMEAGKMTV